MKTALSLAALALLAGCASQPNTQVAQAECKVAPLRTASIAGRAQPADKLEQRRAEADLSTSDYRRSQLMRNGGLHGNLMEEALRDCQLAH